MKMTDAEFWKLIGTIDTGALEIGDEEGALELLTASLGTLDDEALAEFDEHLARALYAIDGIAWARAHFTDGYISEDGFLYARAYAVGLGRERYLEILQNPQRMTPFAGENGWFESLLYAASNVYEERTGKEWDCATELSYETGSNAALWEEAHEG